MQHSFQLVHLSAAHPSHAPPNEIRHIVPYRLKQDHKMIKSAICFGTAYIKSTGECINWKSIYIVLYCVAAEETIVVLGNLTSDSFSSWCAEKDY